MTSNGEHDRPISLQDSCAVIVLREGAVPCAITAGTWQRQGEMTLPKASSYADHEIPFLCKSTLLLPQGYIIIQGRQQPILPQIV